MKLEYYYHSMCLSLKRIYSYQIFVHYDNNNNKLANKIIFKTFPFAT